MVHTLRPNEVALAPYLLSYPALTGASAYVRPSKAVDVADGAEVFELGMLRQGPDNRRCRPWASTEP